MKEKWKTQSQGFFQGNVFINTLQKKFPSRFPSRWSAVKFARGLFREGIIQSASNLKSFEDSEQLFNWNENELSAEWRKMTSQTSTPRSKGFTWKKKSSDEPSDFDIITTIKTALSGTTRKDTTLLNKFFKDLRKDFPETSSSSKQTIERTWINQRLSTASSESSADTINHSYPKFKEKATSRSYNPIYQMASTNQNYSAIPEEDLANLDRSHGGSSLEYELSHGLSQNARRWHDSQFCYSDNEKQLIEEMKKMKRDHNESIQAYEERISKLMTKMHELKGIAEMLENSSMKSSPYGLLPGRANLLTTMAGNKQEKRGAAPGGYTAPPLPPRPTKGNKVYPNKPIIHPKCKMKNLDWSRIILRDGSQNSVTTLWHAMAEPKIDIEELERLFQCYVADGFNLYEDIVNRREKSKHQYVTILASDHSRRLVSTMKILPCELPSVVEGITQMDYQVVPSDRFVELIELIATCNEIDKILYHVKRKGPANIDHPEFFISEISKVDHFMDRIEFMRFKKKIQWHLFEIDQQLRELHTACDEICTSTALRNLLETLLAVGNYMNGGTENGQADGFTIDTINKLKEIQDKDNKTNLLEFVLKMYCQMYETEVDICCPTRFRLPEPSNMRHAAQVSFENVQETLQNLHGELKIHKDKVSETFAQNGNSENAAQVKASIDSFHTSASEMLSEEERLLNDTKDVYEKTAAYFLYEEVPNKPQNFFQIWAIFLHDCKYFWKLAHRRIAKERFEMEFKFKGQTLTVSSHGFDNYKANMYRHLTTLRSAHDHKDEISQLKRVNNWMESSADKMKSEKQEKPYGSNISNSKSAMKGNTSPRPFTSEPPNSASVHKPLAMKTGSTPPHYENQNELDKNVYNPKYDSHSDDKSGNSEKTDKSQFSLKSWLKREPGKRHNSEESKSSAEDKRVDQGGDNAKRQTGETTLSKIKHSVVQKFTGSNSVTKQRQHQTVQMTQVKSEQTFQTPPSFVPLNLNVNDIDPYETSLGRESRFGTMSSEIDLRPRNFEKLLAEHNDLQINSAERRSRFDASKFTYKNVKSRQGSDISTEYASLYHTPPFFAPPVTHIDKDGYASPITLNASSKNDINNNEPKNRPGNDVSSRNRAPLALGSNMSISDVYRKNDFDQTDAKRLHVDNNELSNKSNHYQYSNGPRNANFTNETSSSRNARMNEKLPAKPPHFHPQHLDSQTNDANKFQIHRRQFETPPAKPERTLERYPASSNLSVQQDHSLKPKPSHTNVPLSNEHLTNGNEGRTFLSKSAINRPPITSLIHKFEQEHEQDHPKESAQTSNKQTMLSTSTPITPRRPLTLHDEEDDNPPPLPPRYDAHSTNKVGVETNSIPNSNPHATDSKILRTPFKQMHVRQNTGASDQGEGYKDMLRKVANSAVFDRYKSQTTPNSRSGQNLTPQYNRQGSNQSQFSQQSSTNQPSHAMPMNRQPFKHQEESQFSAPLSSSYNKQTFSTRREEEQFATPVSASYKSPMHLNYNRQDEAQFSNQQSSPFVKQNNFNQPPVPQTRKAGLGRFANTGIHQSHQSSENRSSIHL